MSETVDFDSNPEGRIVDSRHDDDYFIELCAVAGTGTLTPAEWRQLETHLAVCESCRAIKAEYDRVISTSLPAMAANRENSDHGDSPVPWSVEKAEAELFQRIEREAVEAAKRESDQERAHNGGLMAIAAAVLLACTFGAYRFGLEHGRSLNTAAPPVQSVPLSKPIIATKNKVSSADDAAEGHWNARLATLQRRLDQVSSENAMLDNERLSLLNQVEQQNGALRQTEQERADLESRLSLAQANAQSLEVKLDAARASSEALPSSADLLKRVNDLTGELEQRKREIARAEELLEHDRDIRNLMGARDLYIGEIYDVAKSGKTQKPFGRVFYTEGKSLVFYAYDLDQQPGVKLASTFQAWGRKGVDQDHDVSLGVFYQDDQAKKRWVLKSNDSATLAQLDAVFVTVEPHGASNKPTSKPLLFTYLKLPPNHP